MPELMTATRDVARCSVASARWRVAEANQKLAACIPAYTRPFMPIYERRRAHYEWEAEQFRRLAEGLEADDA